jgi:hypothetical protein
MMGRVESHDMLEMDGWILRRLRGYGIEEDGSNCWAEHPCEAMEQVRRGTGKATYGWYPRDNAYFGACCYCGAGCPEGMQAIYMMLNASLLHRWNPKPWARRSEKEVRNSG